MPPFPFALPDEVKQHIGDGDHLVPLSDKETEVFFNAQAGPTLGISDQYTFTSPASKDAILKGNFNQLKTAKKTQSQDLKPNMDAISKHGEKAFIEAINKSDGRHYHICPSDTGYVWVMPLHVETQQSTSTNAEEVHTKATVAVGSYSKNANYMGISVSSWTNIPSVVTATAISSLIANIVGRFVANRIAGLIFQVALERALAAAAADAVAGGLMVRAAVATICGAIVGGIVFIIASIVIMYIIDFVHRSYGLTLNIYNWDTSSGWKVLDWYSDNATINDPDNTGGTGQFKVAELPKVTDSFKGPDGFPIYTVGSIASYGTYTYANDSEWLQGLGVCMKVQNVENPSLGFYFKYVVHRLKDNEIGLQGHTKNSMKDYYNSSWAPSHSYTVDGTVEGPNLPIKGITYSLSGEESHLYTFDVHIGVKSQ